MLTTVGNASTISYQGYRFDDSPAGPGATDQVSIGYWEHTGDQSPATEWGAEGDAPDVSRTRVTSQSNPNGSVNLVLSDADHSKDLQAHFERSPDGDAALVVDNPGPVPPGSLPPAVVKNPIYIALGDLYEADPSFFGSELTPNGAPTATVAMLRLGGVTVVSFGSEGGELHDQFLINEGRISRLGTS